MAGAGAGQFGAPTVRTRRRALASWWVSITLLVIGAFSGFIWYTIGGLPIGDAQSHGAVLVPGTAQINLPVGEVWVFFEESGLGEDESATNPPGLEVTVQSAGGQTMPIEPVSNNLFSVKVNSTGHVPYGRMIVKTAGSYVATTTVAGGVARFSRNPRVLFGEPLWNPFGSLTTGAVIIFAPFLAIALLLRLPLRKRLAWA